MLFDHKIFYNLQNIFKFFTENEFKIRQYCNYPKSDFPGSQPVSLDQGNIQHLAELEYMVSWKADGLRYLILIEGKQKVYAFDRGNNVFNIPRLTFPRHPTDKGITGIEHLKDTLLVFLVIVIKPKIDKKPSF